MADLKGDAAPSWCALPSDRRSRLIVMLGEMALRQLDLAGAALESCHEARHDDRASGDGDLQNRKSAP